MFALYLTMQSDALFNDCSATVFTRFVLPKARSRFSAHVGFSIIGLYSDANSSPIAKTASRPTLASARSAWKCFCWLDFLAARGSMQVSDPVVLWTTSPHPSGCASCQSMMRISSGASEAVSAG
jgi:hypothetical protein